MGADAPWLPRPAPGWPLAATLGAHLLLAWWWMNATTMRLLPSAGPALREFVVVRVLPPSAPPSNPPSARSTPSAPAASIAPAPRAAPPQHRRSASAVDAQANTTAPAPVMESAPPLPASEPYADPLAASASTQDGAASDSDGVAGRARRAASGADRDLRDLRGGKLAPPAPSDTPWQRFAQAVEGARVDKSPTLTSESYTSPDGVTIYRFRKNGRYYCRTGGSVRASPFGAEGGGATLFDKAGGGGHAGLVACPARAEFKRD